MATLADLKTRIIAEMSRDDLSDELSDQLLLHIQRACEFYADERFWFNAVITTANTAASVDNVSVPDTVRRVESVYIPELYMSLREVQLLELNPLTTIGLPMTYAYYNDTLKLYPIPDAVYSLQITGLAQITAPADDADTSAWTNEAQDLIVARAKETLYRAQFRDSEGAQLAHVEVLEALAKLKRETARRLATPLRGRTTRQAFNILTGE